MNKFTSYPATEQQKSIFKYIQATKSTKAYNYFTIWELNGAVDIEKVESAVERLLKQYTILRTIILEENGDIVQRINLDFNVKDFFDFTNLTTNSNSVNENILSYSELKKEIVNVEFNLSKGPLILFKLIQLDNQKFSFIILRNHIISDAASISNLYNEFSKFYNSTEKQDLQVIETAQYYEYALAQKEYLSSDLHKKNQQFFKSRFNESKLNYNLLGENGKNYFEDELDIIQINIQKSVCDSIANFSLRNRLIISSVYHGAFKILLALYSNENDILLGTYYNNRKTLSGLSFKKSLGLFANRLVSLDKIDFTVSLINQLKAISDSINQSFSNATIPFENVIDLMQQKGLDIQLNYWFNYYSNLDDSLNLEGVQSQPEQSVHKLHHSEGIYRSLELQVARKSDGSADLLFLYSKTRYSKDFIKLLTEWYLHILELCVSNPQASIKSIKLRRNEETKNIEFLANQNRKTTYCKTLPDLLRESFSKNSDRIAITLNGHSISYKELDIRSNKVALLLKRSNVKEGSIVGVHMPRSIDLIVGIIGVIKAKCTYLSIDPKLPQNRKDYIIKDANLDAILSEDLKISDAVNIINLKNQIPKVECKEFEISRTEREDRSTYIVYTSGSTGKPKGAILKEIGLLNLLDFCLSRTNLEFVNTLQLASFSFDVSFQEVFLTLLSGGNLVMLEENEIANNNAVLEKIDSSNISTVFMTPSYLNFLFKSDLAEQRLRKLKHIVVAGEQIIVNERLRKFLESNKINLHNHYGPAETHVVTSKTFIPGDYIPNNPNIGKPIQNTEVFIMNEKLEEQPIGKPGELYIGGIQLGEGYLNNPKISNKSYVYHNEHQSIRLYKTGDYGKKNAKGEIEFIGRIDNQVKIRGIRIEIEEIEATLLKIDEISDALVDVIIDNNEKLLVAYYTLNSHISKGEIRNYLFNNLPVSHVPSHYYEVESFPKTISGKLDRNKFKNSKELKVSSVQSNVDEDDNLIHNQVKQLFSLATKISKEEVQTDSDFFTIGGHSLNAQKVLSDLEGLFNIEIKLSEFYYNSTVKQLVQLIQSKKVSKTEETKSYSAQTNPHNSTSKYFKASPSQKNIYSICQLENIGLTYNIPNAFIVNDLNIFKFKNTCQEMVNRYDVLRTSFEIIGSDLFQLIHDKVEIEITVKDVADENLRETVQDSIKQFDLSTPCQLRINIFKLQNNRYALLFDFHHIIVDGASLSVFFRELDQIYNSKTLGMVNYQFKDYCEEFYNYRLSDDAVKKKNYWKNRFSAPIAPLDLILDNKRPPVITFEGNNHLFEIEEQISSSIYKYCQDNNLTLYMFLIANLSILLSKLGRTQDLTLGTIYSGRNHQDISDCLGLFISVLPLRFYPAGEKNLKEYLKEVKEDVLNSLDNQSWLVQEVLEEIQVDRNLSRNPFFDVLFALQNMEDTKVNLFGGETEPVNITGNISKYDISVFAKEKEGRIVINIEYNTNLYKESTIKMLGEYYLKIIRGCCDNDRSLKLSDLQLLDENGIKKLDSQFNDTSVEFQDDILIHDWFEQAVIEHPKKCAIFEGDISITFEDLNKRANQVGSFLRSYNINYESVIAIRFSRSIDMFVGILGILKAGYAYLPIGTDHPEDRVRKIIQKSKAQLILVGEESTFNQDLGIPELNINDKDIEKEPSLNLQIQQHPQNLAYVIFTSGSTGEPKGVMIEHQSVINRINWMQKEYPLEIDDVILQKTTYTFDVSVWELFWWMCRGCSVAILKQGAEKDPAIISEAIEQYNVSVLHFVPSMFNVFLQYLETNISEFNFKSLKYLVTSGEELRVSHVTKFDSIFINNPNVILANLYGPTEATVDVTYYNCKRNENLERVPIGKPIDNTGIFILDETDHVQNVGIPGELAISGVGLARGYINDKELTDKQFVLNTYLNNKRLYKTGDLARWLPDGNLEFLGRIKNFEQVKIRGFRIELREIESLIAKLSFIKDVVVSVCVNNSEDSQLVAYMVPEKKIGSNQINDLSSLIKQVKTHLKKYVPEYMVPNHVIMLDEIPVLTNGKIDRNKLPPPIIIKEEFIEPRNEIDKSIIKIWSELIGIENSEICISSNFFEIGGNSLTATSMLLAIGKDYKMNISLLEFYSDPILMTISDLISKHQVENSVEDSEFETIQL